MTAPISAIGGVGGVGAVGATSATSGASAASGTSASGGGFAAELGRGLDAVSNAQQRADTLAVQSATGASVDPAALTVAMTQATVMTQLASAVQSKAIAAFNTIMGMQA